MLSGDTDLSLLCGSVFDQSLNENKRGWKVNNLQTEATLIAFRPAAVRPSPVQARSGHDSGPGRAVGSQLRRNAAAIAVVEHTNFLR